MKRDKNGRFIKGHVGIGNVFKIGHVVSKNNIIQTKIANTGKKHHWKGGKIIQHGYRCIKNRMHPLCDNKGYVKEHRIIVEQAIGRILSREEEVHHINGNKIDNRLKNLMVFVNSSAHQRFENNSTVCKKEIVFDGRVFK